MILNLAGRDLNDHFEPLPQPTKVVQDIKEKLCYVVLDYELEMASAAKNIIVFDRNVCIFRQSVYNYRQRAIQRLYSIHLSLACLLLVS